MRKLWVLPLILSYTVFVSAVIKMYRADVKYQNSQSALARYELQDALKDSFASIELNPREANYYKGRARVFLLTNQKELALKDLQTAYKINEHNLVTIRNIIPLYYFLAVADLAKPQTKANLDKRYVTVAQDFYKKVKDISPNDAGVYILLAKYEKKLGLTDDYNMGRKKVNSLRPDLLQWNETFID